MTMLPFRRLLLIAVAATVVLAAPASAQKVDNKYREFPALGFKFKAMKEWSDVPLQDRDKQVGRIAQMDAERGIYVKAGNDRVQFRPSLLVLKIDPKAVTTDDTGDEGGGLRGRVGREKAKEKTSKDYVYANYSGGLRKAEFDEIVPESEDVKFKKGLIVKRDLIPTFLVSGSAVDVFFDVWVIPTPNFKLVFIWTYPSDKKVAKKYSKAVEKSMKTFKFDDVVASEVTWIDEDSPYEDVLAFHEDEVAQTPGWRIIETPSKKYLIKTNSDKDKRLKDVVKRLEASRKLFEEDFPPSEPMTNISVVRICGTEEDFHKYGKTGGGVAGWFSPATTELVLFFNPSMGYDATMSVMTHEGFHQYCHFLFAESEAHRWFDEGHGDYYGAFKMKGSSLKPNDDMAGGLARTPEIKKMLRNGTIKPLSEHLRYDHGEWQSQGPSGVSCYAQSFSIIYFLREGARGRVGSRYWEDEYADIIPNYMRYLAEGYAEAYVELRGELQEVLDALKKSGDAKKEDIMRLEERLKNIQVSGKYKQDIWNKAMAESWGKIDEQEFEEAWLKFIDKEL
jgi:hypothetical protein